MGEEEMRREERNDAIARGAQPPTMHFRLLTVKATAAGHRAVELWMQAGRPAIEGPFVFADAPEQPAQHIINNSETGQRTQATEPRPAGTRAALGAVRNLQPTWAKIAEAGPTRADFQRIGKNGEVAKLYQKSHQRRTHPLPGSSSEVMREELPSSAMELPPSRTTWPEK